MKAAVVLRVGIAVESTLWGGLESHVLDLAHVLAARGHHPVIICSNTHTLELFQRRATFEVVAIPPFTASGVVGLWRALRALKLGACVFEKGTLHAGSFVFDAAAWLACGRYITIQQLAPPVLPSPSRRRVLGVTSPSLWRRRMIWDGWLRSLVPQVTVCVSDAVAVALRDDYNFPPRKLVTVRNGVDVDRFRDDQVAALRLRAEWQVPASCILFGAVCRLVPEKGLDLCLQAFRRVLDGVGPSTYLVVVGDGPERDGLERLAERLGLWHRVRFAGFRTDVPEVLSALDYLVLSSRMEGLPLIVVESLAVGRPVIATRVAGTPEIFTRDDIGWLVSPDNVAELANAMQEAATQSSSQVRLMRDAARRHAVDCFNAFHEYERIASLLESDQRRFNDSEAVS
jgi:glycosyltransferase involved in cell wall biosynthesis